MPSASIYPCSSVALSLIASPRCLLSSIIALLLATVLAILSLASSSIAFCVRSAPVSKSFALTFKALASAFIRRSSSILALFFLSISSFSKSELSTIACVLAATSACRSNPACNRSATRCFLASSMAFALVSIFSIRVPRSLLSSDSVICPRILSRIDPTPVSSPMTPTKSSRVLLLVLSM